MKEADALVDAGHQVHVIGAFWAEWATACDATLTASRGWSYTFVDWRRRTAPLRFWHSGARQRLAQAATEWPRLSGWMTAAAAGRVTPELTRAAGRVPADLYIAHNLAALPAAGAAAARHRARLGFDAEDYHSGQFADADVSVERRVAVQIEERWIPRCDYVTAASPGIADAYARLCARRASTILNVFPLHMRPAVRRPAAPSGPLTLYWFSQTAGPDRGLEDVVRAMAKLADGAVECHIRGSVSDAYRASLMKLASACNLSERRIVWHAPDHPDEMVRLASRFDVGLAVEPGHTRNSDLAVSNKIFTYVLAGLAVAASGTTGQQAVAAQLSPAVVICPPGDVDALAAALARWARDR